jgi:hypothetical protein
MTEYVVQLEGRDDYFPTAIMIISKEMYERDLGSIEHEQNFKIVDKYPSKLEKNLKDLLGNPVMICPESKVFTISKDYSKCVLKMFDNLECIYKRTRENI